MAEETAPPPIIASARVLHYAIVDESVRYTPRGKLFSGSEEIGAVPCLAIVRNLVDGTVMLFHCSEEWDCIVASGGGDVDEVREHANRRYEGLASKWLAAAYSDVDFAKAMADDFGDQRCSFCGKYHFELGDVTMFGGDDAMICGECVERMHETLNAWAREGRAAAGESGSPNV